MKENISVDNVSLALIGSGIAVAGLSSWYFGRRLIFARRVYRKLTEKQKDKNKKVNVGDYCLVEGKVTKVGKDILKTPKSKEICVEYNSFKIRVGEEIVVKGSSFNFGLGSLFNRSKKAPVGGGAVVGKTKQSADRKRIEEVLSIANKKVAWTLEENNRTQYIVDLESFKKFSNDLKKLKVMDLYSLLNLPTPYEEFTPSTSKAGDSTHFLTLGYKWKETVLREGQRLVVLGEVLLKEEMKSNQLRFTVSAPSQKNILDLKTARTRPFLVSTLSREELRKKFQWMMLLESAKLFPFVIISSLTFVFGVKRVVL